MARDVLNPHATSFPSKGSEPSTGRILIVDDDRSARNVLAAILTDAGISCATVANGEEALEVIALQSFEAVLADLQMPGITGMQLLAEIQTRLPFVAFVMVTGVDDVRVGIEAMKHGADDFLVKPLQCDVVLASLHRALQKKELERELNGHRQRLEEMVRDRTQQLESALQQVERSYGETLQALGAAIDLRDGETAGHSRRVASYASRIARELSAPERQLKTIVIGAWLHDIGKLAIPDAILLKPGSLTKEEWVVMRTHVEIGFDLVRRIPFLSEAAEIVLTHHERCDGSGYPRGLTGSQIPFGSKVFAIADTLDAMTSNRPYRPALPIRDAIEEIRRGLGVRYDHQVATAFLEIPAQEWETSRLKSAEPGIASISLRSKDGFTFHE